MLRFRPKTAAALALAAWTAMTPSADAQVETASGPVVGTTSADGRIAIFKGIPYARPPVADRRWRAPEPMMPWTTPRQATAFAPRCLQGPIFEDMVFRDEPSEDCLYLNVWAPAGAGQRRLPVMVWIHGGGFQAGSASEPRQDGERLAGSDIVVVSINHRLGVFGFLAHPELTKESPHHASGNYGLLDLIAGLAWVRANIASFGGDPGNVTIFGESAGSFAVSALMASPLAQGLFHKAIGESGAFLAGDGGTLTPMTLAASEAHGRQLAASMGIASMAALRAQPAADVLEAALKVQPWFTPTIDGYVLPRKVSDIYAAGAQSHVPLLAGWNADEARAGVVFGPETVTRGSFAAALRTQYGDRAGAVLERYPAGSDAEALESAAALASDRFIAFATWKWIEMHAATGRSPVYRYRFDRKIPVPPGNQIDGRPATPDDIGARHAGEIEYVFGTLDSIPKVAWTPADRQLSEAMMAYWRNFARRGDPNGEGLPVWPAYEPPGRQLLFLDSAVHAGADPLRPRYELLDALIGPGKR